MHLGGSVYGNDSPLPNHPRDMRRGVLPPAEYPPLHPPMRGKHMIFI